MASVIAHELEEATTDPDLNAWYDTARLRERRQVRVDVRHDVHGRQRREGQHDARRPQLPDPAELGERERRLLRTLVLSGGVRRRPMTRAG